MPFRPITGAVSRLSVVIWATCSVVAVVAGPFGTYASMDLGARSAYWTILIGLSIVMGHAIRTSTTEYFPRLSRNVSDAVFTVTFSLMFSVVIYVVNHQFLDYETHALLNFAELLLFVFAISFTVAVVRRFVQDSRARGEVAGPASNPSEVEISEQPRLIGRIAQGHGRRIVRMTVDDHYVIVHLSDGSEQRLLMRFADAVAEMAGQAGLLSHRSHWVSLDMVAGVCREGTKEVVVLKDGGHVPLSRTYRGAFEELGFVAPAPSRMAMTTE